MSGKACLSEPAAGGAGPDTKLGLALALGLVLALELALDLALLGAGLGGCRPGPVAGAGQTASPITREQEIALGERAAPALSWRLGGPVPSEALQLYVWKVGRRVAARAERSLPYEFRLLASDEATSYALPGGKVFVSSGLLLLLRNERQLAALLAHEVAHAAALHPVRGLQRRLGRRALAALAEDALAGSSSTPGADAAAPPAAPPAPAPALAGTGPTLAAGLIDLRYGRRDEQLADELAVRYLAEAGYSPWGMVELLQRLQEAALAEPGRLSELVRAHPLGERRLHELRRLVQQNHPLSHAAEADPQAARFARMRKLLVDLRRR